MSYALVVSQYVIKKCAHLTGLTLVLMACVMIHSQWAQAVITGAVPAECRRVVGSGRPKVMQCMNNDLGQLNINKNKKLQNMCMFFNGAWSIGTLEVDPNGNKKSFTPKWSCSEGIQMSAKVTTNQTHLGPKSNDVVNACAEVGYDSSTCKSDSTVPLTLSSSGLSESLNKLNMQLNSCYRTDGGVGSGAPRPCQFDPTKANYCELVNLDSSLALAANLSADFKKSASPGESYKGSWYVQYQADGKQSPIICKGGVMAIARTGEVRKTFRLIGSTGYSPSISQIPQSYSVAQTVDSTTGLTVVGCQVTNTTPLTYFSCVKPCNFFDSATGSCTKTNFSVDQTKAGACYYYGGGWKFLKMKSDKTLQEKSCNYIDAISGIDTDDGGSNNAEDAISITKDTVNAQSTLKLGPGSDNSKRPFAIVDNGTTGENVVAIGKNACLIASDCAAFSVSAVSLSGAPSSGVLQVGDGSRFAGNALFKKDLTVMGTSKFGAVQLTGATQVTGDTQVTGKMTVQSITASGTVSAGTLTASTVTATSDLRAKKDVTAMTDVLEKIMRLRGVYYQFDEKQLESLSPEWIASLKKNPDEREKLFNHRRVGLVAQEVEQVFPEVVFTDSKHPDHLKSISYGDLSAVALEGIKEMYGQMIEMNQNMNVLKLQLEELKKENKMLRQELSER